MCCIRRRCAASSCSWRKPICFARWTLDIHEEWIRNLLLKRPDLSRDKLEGLRDMMIEVIPDSLVTGYEPAIDGLQLPDPDDRHVLAAALRANAETIVTANLKDFPAESLKPYNVVAQHTVLESKLAMQEQLIEALKESDNPPKIDG